MGRHHKLLLPICRKGDVWGRAFFCFTSSNIPRSPIFHGNTGNRYLVLTHGELIGVALAGCESRDAGERFCCCFAFSFCHIKREEGCGVLGFAWLDKGIELLIAVLIRFHTTDAETIDVINRGSGILVFEAINLYYHSRHFSLHGESEVIAIVGIGLRTAKRHEVGGSKRFYAGVFRRLGDGSVERSRVVGGEIHRLAFPFQELAALWLPFIVV